MYITTFVTTDFLNALDQEKGAQQESFTSMSLWITSVNRLYQWVSDEETETTQ